MSKISEVGVADSYASYDAATGKYEAQTRQQFYNSLTADIQRSLDAGALDEPPKPKSLREIQADEVAAAEAKAAAQQKAVSRAECVASEKAAAEAAWNADRAARNAAGHTPCWVCWQYAGETQHHAPKRDKCDLANQLFYVWDRWGQPHTAYVRRDVLEGVRASQAQKRWAEETAAAEAAKKAELAALVESAEQKAAQKSAATAEQKPKGGKKAKKATVEKFSLDEI